MDAYKYWDELALLTCEEKSTSWKSWMMIVMAKEMNRETMTNVHFETGG